MTTLRETLITHLARLLGVEAPVRIVALPQEVRVPQPAPPVDYVATLTDEPGRVYVWIVREGATDDKITKIVESLADAPPMKALHIVTRDIAEIRRLAPEDIKAHLLPVVKAAEEAGWQ